MIRLLMLTLPIMTLLMTAGDEVRGDSYNGGPLPPEGFTGGFDHRRDSHETSTVSDNVRGDAQNSCQW